MPGSFTVVFSVFTSRSPFYITNSCGFELLASFPLENGLRTIRNVSKIYMNSFFKAYLILMKLISISQFYAPEPCLIHAYSFVAHGETL